MAGLSNGYTEEQSTDPAGRSKIIKRKTLQLDFERLGAGEPTEPIGHPLDRQRDLDVSGLDRPAEDGQWGRTRRRTTRRTRRRMRRAPRLEPIPTFPVKRMRD